MKKVLSLVILILIVSCNEKNRSEPATELAAEKTITMEEVEKAVDSLNYALINPSQKRLGLLTAEKLSYGHSSGLIQDRNQFIRDATQGGFNFRTIDITDQNIQINESTAVVRHIFSSGATSEGTPVKIRIGNMLVFQKKQDGLKLIARQAYKL